MGVKATELRKGTVLERDGDLLIIIEYVHKTPGNLRSFFQIKTKSLKTGVTKTERLSSSETFEVAFLDRRKAEYLYKDPTGYIFMDSETYEQFTLTEDLVAEPMGFVRENTEIEVTFHSGNPIGVSLPPSVVLKVTEAEIAVKGNSANNVKKDAELETGRKIRVPAHIDVGEEIKVSTETGDFMGRAN